MKEAKYYEKIENQKVRCILCPRYCIIEPSKSGFCGVRRNIDGKLYTLVYGRVVARHVDPIEKKPLYHFLPGSRAYSIATVGCNLACKFCQNYEISQYPREGRGVVGEKFYPEDLVNEAKQLECEVIAYTYTEPTIFYELALDTAKLAHKEGIKNVFVTNGYINEEPLREIAKYLDAVNVDLKSMRDEFYWEVCSAHLAPVLESIKNYRKYGVWIEITTLVIPGYNDSKEELTRIAKFIKGIGDEVPWHVSAFYPHYKFLHVPRTPVDTLRMAYDIGREIGLRYVYEGNVGEGEDTYCYNCGKLLVRRYYHSVLENRIVRGSRCYNCGAIIDGIGMDWHATES